MSWKSYFFPQTMIITSSPYNHLIRVNEEWGKMKLLVDRSPQSGSYIENLWTHAFEHFFIHNKHVKNALVLGVGGGTVISLLSSYFPGIRQTCVDIDSVIIDIAEKYFHIHSSRSISIVHADAKDYVRKLSGDKQVFDCIIVDISVGPKIPSFVEKKQFILQLKKLLSSKGFLCMNYLREKEYMVKSDQLYGALKSEFSVVLDYGIAFNRFFYACIG